ncbi:glycosyltransferase [Janibacter sp. G1551]|uniref:glycosyltransferase n=1 Tax=Janibacter sp. G1551 TaxID=3420440 RepID=UPI003CFD3DDA
MNTPTPPPSMTTLARRLAAAGRRRVSGAADGPAGDQSTPGTQGAKGAPATSGAQPVASGAQPVSGTQAATTTPDAPSAQASPAARPLPEPVTAPALDVRALVALSPRLRAVLAPEWQQSTLDPAAWRPSLASADLVLVELAGGEVPGWTAPDLETLVDAAVEASVPVAVWVTSGPVPEAAWLSRATSIGAVTPALVDEATTHTTAPVALWEPAAQPRLSGLDREDATTGRRAPTALTIIDGLDSLPDDTHLRDVIAPALSKLTAAETPVIRVDGHDARVTAPRLLTDRQVASGAWREIAGALADTRVLLDLGDSAPGAPWTSLAAAVAQTPLVGTSGLGRALPASVDELVPRVEDEKDLRSELRARLQQDELVRREGLRLQRAVLADHTAGHRARAVLESVGRTVPTADRSISAVVPTNREHELDNVFANIGRQSHTDTELVLVLHGLETDDQALIARAREAGVERVQIVHADRSLTLGACMNLGVDAAEGRYIAKMDDDNFYGVHYLSDLVDSFSYTDAGIVGKWAHYVWLRSTGAVVMRYFDSEHRYERRIQGGSMLFDGDVARSVRFSDIPRAVDSDILDRSAQEGVRIYSGDRYNFVSIRGTDRLAHTWTVTDSTFMTATGQLLFYGDPREHVSV